MKLESSSTNVVSTTPTREDRNQIRTQTIGLGLIGAAIALVISTEGELGLFMSLGIIPYVWFMFSAGLFLVAHSISIVVGYTVASIAALSGILFTIIAINHD